MSQYLHTWLNNLTNALYRQWERMNGDEGYFENDEDAWFVGLNVWLNPTTNILYGQWLMDNGDEGFSSGEDEDWDREEDED